MKLLILVVVSLVAILMVDCHNFAHGGREGLEAANGEEVVGEENQQLKEGNFYDVEGPEHLGYSEIDQQVEKVVKAQSKRKLMRSTCKARNSCVVMGGFCVTNATLCSGRLVPEGCKRPGCQCCVPGTMEQKIQNLEDELNSMKIKLSQDNTEIKAEINSMKDNITGVISNQAGCPISSGFFLAPGSNQCLKVFLDKLRTWPEADAKCKSAGLLLVKPYDAAALSKYMLERYYAVGQWYWVGARGDGSYIKWQRDEGLGQTYLHSSSSLWRPNYPGSRLTSSYCLQLTAAYSYIKSDPEKVYYLNSCTGDREYALCELILG